MSYIYLLKVVPTISEHQFQMQCIFLCLIPKKQSETKYKPTFFVKTDKHKMNLENEKKNQRKMKKLQLDDQKGGFLRMYQGD